MSSSTSEKPAASDDILEAARSFAANLPRQDVVTSALHEGEAIAEIVRSLGLPANVVAAVLLYPLFRDELVDNKQLENISLNDIPRLVRDLVQLGQISLSAD